MFKGITGKIPLSLYWKCQIVGWSIVSLFWLYIALVRDNFTLMEAGINYVLDITICIALTHIYRIIALRFGWNHLKIKPLIIRVVPSITLLSFLFMQVMNLKTSGYVYLIYRNNIFIENLFAWNPVLITGVRHMSIWVLAYHLYHFYKKEVETTKVNAQLSIIAKQAQLDNLSAQLNPHFLFNSLNSIKALVIENPKIARRAIDLLSDLLRSSLSERKLTTATIGEELDLVKDFIELEKLRFESRLKVEFDVDKNLYEHNIPFFSIQLLLENAIKHGIGKKMEGGIITISIQKRSHYIKIQVRNPGLLINENGGGVGLKNLKHRLLLSYGEDAELSIVQLSKKEVGVTLLIPINKNEFV